jgi:hypothetical protein
MRAHGSAVFPRLSRAQRLYRLPAIAVEEARRSALMVRREGLWLVKLTH